jgi:hypothetical protein
MSGEETLREMPLLGQEALVAAWEYYVSHTEEIDRALWRNEAVMVENVTNIPDSFLLRGWLLGLTLDEICNAFEPPLPMQAVEFLNKFTAADSSTDPVMQEH